ncbi:MAG TPA: NADH-quinone oxidoreductase subunit J [Mucilaginibacter sp.]|jgi:NADH-quinone oxidoreductase subunit J|nr:NADH-quinone oxidoreductase subunit J [Mucilaginibacter sp.]
MTMEQVLFYLMAGIAVGSALYVAATKNLVRSVFMFFVTLMAVAGLFVPCMADFVAITQVVIYVGGILVLIIFAFMLSGRETLANLQQQSKFISISKVPAFLLAGLFFIVLLNIILKGNVNGLVWTEKAVLTSNVITAKDTTIDNIGVNLMGNYLLPFEAISILLMMALVGAAHLSRKERGV